MSTIECLSFIRFSSIKQELGSSLDRQMFLAERWVEQQNQISDNTYVLSPQSYRELGVSGFRNTIDRRPALSEFLGLCKAGKIVEGSILLCEKIDRLSRRPIQETQKLISDILETGVEIVLIQEGMHLNRDSPNRYDEVIRLATYIHMANQYSQNLQERVSHAKNKLKDKARQGIPIRKRLPFWISYDSETQDYYLNDRQVVVRFMIERRLAGDGFSLIAKKLNARLGDPLYKPPWSDKWNRTTISDTLRKPVIIGTYTIGRVDETTKFHAQDMIPGYFPSIATVGEYKQVSSRATKYAGGRQESKASNHLSGIVYCQCNEKMFKKISRQKVQGKTKEYYSWVCKGNQTGTCDSTPIRDLDQCVFWALDHMKIITKDDSKTFELNKTIAFYRNRVESLATRLETAPENILDSLLSLLGKAKDSLTEANRKLSEATANPTTNDDIAELKTLISDHVQFNIKLKMHFSKIVVNPKEAAKGRGFWWVSFYRGNMLYRTIEAVRASIRSPFAYRVIYRDIPETLLDDREPWEIEGRDEDIPYTGDTIYTPI
ncbi:recombinase family protein [Sansalvadorimonas verongulae]|uniref:recombinase family protein n=1 Tax=Sansalvadorimonas verongulae TaxID=2172824 RepID=UPI0012BC2209|nr:recombinase family protein [Sansalvadorimonas verongulae]MTI12868.1 recombinase family protein [Sansalvadorimonas verongulae]